MTDTLCNETLFESLFTVVYSVQLNFVDTSATAGMT